MAHKLTIIFGLVVLSLFMLSVVHCEGDLESSNNENDKDDLETAEFLFWPKLFFFKKAAVAKTITVNTVPVEYTYKPVTYTAYKWVPVPYQVTVQQPVVKAPAAVSVGVVKTPVSLSTGVSVSADASSSVD